MTTTVRISDATHERLAALSAATGRRMQAIMDEAVAAYEETAFWDALSRGYAELADDPDGWASVQAERDGEAPALTDGVG